MTPSDLRTWRSSMGMSQAVAAMALGMTQQNYAKMELGTAGINQRTALACAALAAGLVPWRSG